MKREERKKFKTMDRTKFSLAGQVLIFSLLASMLTAGISYFVLKNKADERVAEEKKRLAEQITEAVVTTVKGYPAYEWLLEYWFIHSDGMEVEYNSSEKTRQKARAFSRRHPGLVLDDISTDEAVNLSEEDQCLYAEVVYNRWVMLLNQLKQIYQASYISIILMDEDYKSGTFLLSGASADQKRGSNYGDAYVIGVDVEVTPAETECMKVAEAGGRSLDLSGNYIDSFGYVQDILFGHHVIVGVTYDNSSIHEEVRGQVISGIFIFMILQIGLAIVLYIMIYFLAVRPIGRIQRNVWDYREKKDSRKVLEDLSKISLGNELGALSSDISDMVVSIDDYVEEIQDITYEKEKIAAELNVAKKIQADMLPSKFPAYPDRKEFDLFASMTPAKQVGGDFYDFFFVDDTHIVLVIADVSGKGIPAALFMVNSMTRIQNQANVGHTPKEILSLVNDQLCEDNQSGFFVTVWIAIIDIMTGKGIAANAGHEHPVLRRAGGDYETLIYQHSPALGVVKGLPFMEHEFELYPGDRIFVYTDGVLEATDSGDELFGEERMLASLNSHKEDSVTELLKGVKKDIDLYVGDAPQFDDITMLGFDYFGPEEPGNVG